MNINTIVTQMTILLLIMIVGFVGAKKNIFNDEVNVYADRVGVWQPDEGCRVARRILDGGVPVFVDEGADRRNLGRTPLLRAASRQQREQQRKGCESVHEVR